MSQAAPTMIIVTVDGRSYRVHGARRLRRERDPWWKVELVEPLDGDGETPVRALRRELARALGMDVAPIRKDLVLEV